MTDNDLIKSIRSLVKEELEPIKKTLEGHTAILEEHTKKLDGLTSQLADVSEDVSEIKDEVTSHKKRIAKISGIVQVLLAIMGFMEVIRRFIGVEEIPNSLIMMSISFLSLIANATSLFILHKSKNNEVHIEASKIFTSNDVIVNIGVIFAGFLVFLLNSRIPDLIVGSIIFIIVIKGAIRIIKLSKKKDSSDIVDSSI